jgi:hypothetical protein
VDGCQSAEAELGQGLNSYGLARRGLNRSIPAQKSLSASVLFRHRTKSNASEVESLLT